jgi:hypothetical protein
MSDLNVAIWLGVVLVVETIAILVFIFKVLFEEDDGLHPVLKTGLLFMVFGIAIQCIRTIHYFQFGAYPVDQFFPLWVTKDIGICISVYYYAFIQPKLNKGS